MGDVGVYPGNREAWASAQVALAGQEVAPPVPADIAAAHPYVVAGIVVFDVWIHNVDRHEENLIYHPSLGLWIIDHDQCLAGSQADLATTLRGSKESLTKSWAFVAADVHQGHAGDWINRIKSCSAAAVEQVVRGVRDRHLATAEEAEAIRVFLSYRSSNLGDLVRRSVGWPGKDEPTTDAGEGTKGGQLWS
jgi:hypothetical protein